MSTTYIILPINERVEQVDQAKLTTILNIQQNQTLILIGEKAEKFAEDNSLNNTVYGGEVAVGLCNAYQNITQKDPNADIVFKLLAAEYPVLRLLAEKTINKTHKVEYDVIPSGVRGVFYEDVISYQTPLMMKYINVLENIETPNVTAVLEAVTKPYKISE